MNFRRLAMNLNDNLEECPIVHDDVFLIKDESLIAFIYYLPFSNVDI